MDGYVQCRVSLPSDIEVKQHDFEVLFLDFPAFTRDWPKVAFVDMVDERVRLWMERPSDGHQGYVNAGNRALPC